MKKSIALLMLLAATAISPVMAQINFGVKGGTTLTKSLSGAWEDKMNTDSYTGFFIGPMVDLRIPLIGLGVDGALMYSQKGTKLGGETVKQQGIEVPVNLKKTFGLGSLVGVYVAVGPSFFFNFASDKTIEVSGKSGKVEQEGAEVSANFGAGVKLFSHLQVGVNYNLPVTNTAKFVSTDYEDLNGKKFKSKGWQISLAYLF